MDVEAIVARIWPGEEARVEVLGGGITNHNFRVDVPDGAYVLRIAGRDTSLLGIDRSVEHEASLAAGRGDQAAIYYDSPVTNAQASYSYTELLFDVATLAAVLQNMGVGKGDRVALYMPLVPELDWGSPSRSVSVVSSPIPPMPIR